jgi:hypothetical protein
MNYGSLLGPECSKMETPLAQELTVLVKKHWHMVETNRSQGMKIIVWEEFFPPFRDKSPIDPLESRVQPFVTPREEAAMQVDFFQNRVV